MANLKPEEIRLNRIDSSLKTNYKYDIKKVRLFFKSLLTNCLTALAENDYNKYNLAESVLNENLVKIGSSIDNFETFYSNVKHEVSIEFLEKLLETDLPILNNNPVEAILITSDKAEEIKEIWDYIHFSVAKNSLYNYWKSEGYYKTFGNEKYTVLINIYSMVIIDKELIKGTYLDSNFKVDISLDSELDVIEGFVTKESDLTTSLTITERIVLSENEIDYTAYNNINSIIDSLEDRSIIYYNESESFIVLINESFYKIINKKTGKSINFYLTSYDYNLVKYINFLAEFSNYCLGVEGTLKPFEVIEDEIIFKDHIEENVPSNEEGVIENED